MWIWGCFAFTLCLWCVTQWLSSRPAKEKPVKVKAQRVPSRDEGIAEAEREYEKKCRMIDKLPLDEDERNAAKRHAKNQLLERLKEVL